MEPELHLIVFWEFARPDEKRLLADLERYVEIIATDVLSWPGDPEACFARFYGANLPAAADKVASCGGGSFRFVIVRDPHPVYGWKETSRGHERVNLNLFALKERYRAETGGGHKVHTTNSIREARRDVMLLTGRPLADWAGGECVGVREVLPGSAGWPSLRAVFAFLEETMPYVVLRNAETLPDVFDPEIHGDIDLLVPDGAECAGALGARKVFPEPWRVHYELVVGGRPVRFDFRSVGDGYYDEVWERDMLARRVLRDGVRVLAPRDALFALVYHAVLQKKAVARDYPAKIAALARAAEVPGDTLDDWFVALGDYMGRNGYAPVRPNDRSVHFDPVPHAWRRRAGELEATASVRDVRPFGLAHRTPSVNDLFLSATFDGRVCVVKHSVEAAASITSEYRLGRRFHAVAPNRCAEPLFWHRGASKGAFVGTALVVGRTLEDVLAAGVPLPEASVCRIVRGLVEIADALRKSGVVHRDIRPANLMVTADGDVRLIDFQFAVDRTAYVEDAWLCEHALDALRWLGQEYAYGQGKWNDRHSLLKCLAMLPICGETARAETALREGMEADTLVGRVRGRARRRLRKKYWRLLFRRLRRRLLGKRFKEAELFDFLRTVLFSPRGEMK